MFHVKHSTRTEQALRIVQASRATAFRWIAAMIAPVSRRSPRSNLPPQNDSSNLPIFELVNLSLMKFTRHKKEIAQRSLFEYANVSRETSRSSGDQLFEKTLEIGFVGELNLDLIFSPH